MSNAPVVMSRASPSREMAYACCHPSRSLSKRRRRPFSIHVNVALCSTHASSWSTNIVFTSPVVALARSTVLVFCSLFRCCSTSSSEFAAQSVRAT
jgi:hypothetical protein